MNCYMKEFFKRGLIFSGLGPIVLGIVYMIIERSSTDLKLTGANVLIGIITTYIIAFVQAGSSVFNSIESWSRVKGILFQMLSIYVVYMTGYLINNWIPFKPLVIIIFTSVFITIYLSIWLIIYLISKNVSKKLNEKLNKELK